MRDRPILNGQYGCGDGTAATDPGEAGIDGKGNRGYTEEGHGPGLFNTWGETATPETQDPIGRVVALLEAPMQED